MMIQFKLLMAAKTPKNVYTVKPQLSRPQLSGIFDYQTCLLGPFYTNINQSHLTSATFSHQTKQI